MAGVYLPALRLMILRAFVDDKQKSVFLFFSFLSFIYYFLLEMKMKKIHCKTTQPLISKVFETCVIES